MTSKTLKVGLDTNCIISLFNAGEKDHKFMQIIERMHKEKQIELHVSLKVIDQLAPKGGSALEYANSLPNLPNYPVGFWIEQVGSWSTAAGTWDDAKSNHERCQKLGRLVKKNSDIRDKQIVIDCYCGGMDVFVTNDGDLCAAGPASRLKKELGFTVISPADFVRTYGR